MSEYKEIRQWLYLSNNEICFNIAYVLAIVNGASESTIFQQQESRALSFTRLRKDIKKAGAKINLVPAQTIQFIKDINGEPIDKFSASQEEIEALSTENLYKLLEFEKQRLNIQQSENNFKYKYKTYGEITRNSDNELFINIEKTRYDIEGRGYTNGNMIYPNYAVSAPSAKVLIYQAKKYQEALSENNEIIKISPTEIDFGDRNRRPNNAEWYVSRKLHDFLYNKYISGKTYDLGDRIKTIDELLKSTPKISDYASNKKGNITTYEMSLNDVEAFNKNNRRIVKKITEKAKEQVKKSWELESHSRHELIEAQRRLHKIRELLTKNNNSQPFIDQDTLMKIKNLTNQY
ncbi:hypothetical protein LX03_08015 [Limosilactobacillus mucosae]|uniref:Uncharacterized protein n=1 Tax=Limosilactobacillus mucosae TaxID=97478 RepID=A0A099YCG9_LIMMU|nr:hypothetical protein LX03_08015 [Limosilactobacillus mucosae]